MSQTISGGLDLTPVTCLIPMYRTSRHLDIVRNNIWNHVEVGGSVVCSDQHLLDDAADRLRDEFSGEPNVRVFAHDDGGDWLHNVNFLMSRVETDFFRIMPHDDTVPARSTGYLVETLQADPGAVLCTGRVLGLDIDDNRKPERDEPNLPLVPEFDGDQARGLSLRLFWSGLFNGSFKSLIRTETVRSHAASIRVPGGLIHAERAWLFGLSLLGRFHYDERAVLYKRYWEGSLTDDWQPGSRETLDAARCMVSYVEDFVADETTRKQMRFNLFLNALARAQWLDGISAHRPLYDDASPEMSDAHSA